MQISLWRLWSEANKTNGQISKFPTKWWAGRRKWWLTVYTRLREEKNMRKNQHTGYSWRSHTIMCSENNNLTRAKRRKVMDKSESCLRVHTPPPWHLRAQPAGGRNYVITRVRFARPFWKQGGTWNAILHEPVRWRCLGLRKAWTQSNSDITKYKVPAFMLGTTNKARSLARSGLLASATG